MINCDTSPHDYPNHHIHLSPIDTTQMDPMLHLHYSSHPGSTLNNEEASMSIGNSTSSANMHSSFPQDSYSTSPQQMYTTCVSPLKRKLPPSYVHSNRHSNSHSHSIYSGSTTTTDSSNLLHSSSSSLKQICQICQYSDPILFVPKCGHTFHSRCVHAWPMEKCPVCDEPVYEIGLFQMDMKHKIEPRSGKWSRDEESFVYLILKEFDRQSFPLANGTPVRLVLAKLLNCSTMRLSKKFQKKALGKRTFRIQKNSQNSKFYFDKQAHIMRQKEFSYFESMFRIEVEELHRREHNSEINARMEVENIRLAVNQFWMINFLKFAIVIGQPVQGLDTSDARKRKIALKKINDGTIDDFLGWNTTSPLHVSNLSPFMINPQQMPPIHSSDGANGEQHYDQLCHQHSHQHPTWQMITDTLISLLPQRTDDESTEQPFDKKMKLSSEHQHQQQASSHLVPLEISCDVSSLPSLPQQNRFHFRLPYHEHTMSTTAGNINSSHSSSYYDQHQSSPQYSHEYYVSSHHSHCPSDLEPLHHAYGSSTSTSPVDARCADTSSSSTSSSASYIPSAMSSEMSPCPLDQLLDDMSKDTSSHATDVHHQGEHSHWTNSLPLM